MTNAQIVERIQALADAKGLSRKFVLESCGIVDRNGQPIEAYFYDVSKGRRKLKADHISAFAAALRTTPAYLLGETDDPAQKEKPVHLDEQEVIKAVREAFGEQAAEIIALCQNATERWKDAALDVLRRAQ